MRIYTETIENYQAGSVNAVERRQLQDIKNSILACNASVSPLANLSASCMVCPLPPLNQNISRFCPIAQISNISANALHENIMPNKMVNGD